MFDVTPSTVLISSDPSRVEPASCISHIWLAVSPNEYKAQPSRDLAMASDPCTDAAIGSTLQDGYCGTLFTYAVTVGSLLFACIKYFPSC